MEIILPDYQAATQREELVEPLSHRYPASRPMPSHLDCDQKAVAEVEELLGIEPDILEALESPAPDLQIAVVAVERSAHVKEDFSSVKLDRGIKRGAYETEVTSIERRVSLSDDTQQHHPAQPRSLW